VYAGADANLHRMPRQYQPLHRMVEHRAVVGWLPELSVSVCASNAAAQVVRISEACAQQGKVT
jgi:hypothetical protein